MRKCTFAIECDLSVRFEGETDGSQWNGFPNVVITAETRERINELMSKHGTLCFDEDSEDAWGIMPHWTSDGGKTYGLGYGDFCIITDVHVLQPEDDC